MAGIEAARLERTGGWSALAVTLAVQALVAMASMALPVAAPVVAKSLGFPVEQTGTYMAAMFSASIVATLAAGSLVARFGAIRVSQWGLLLCAVGLALCSVGSTAALTVGVVLVGLGYGPITPASSHLLALTTPAHRLSLVFSVKQTGVPLGGMLAGMLVPGMLLAIGWQWALAAVGIACACCAVVAQPLRAALDSDANVAAPLGFGTFAKPLKLIVSTPALLKLALMSMLLCSIQLCITTYLVTYLNGRLGYTLVAAGLVLAVAQASGAMGRVLWGHAADSWLAPARVLALLGALIACGSVAVALLEPGTPVVAVCVLLGLLGACAIGWNGVYLAEVARTAPKGMASAATSGSLVFTYVGMVAGPAAFSALLRASDSWRLGFASLALPALACMALLLAPAFSRRR